MLIEIVDAPRPSVHHSPAAGHARVATSRTSSTASEGRTSLVQHAAVPFLSIETTSATRMLSKEAPQRRSECFSCVDVADMSGTRQEFEL